MRSISHFEMWRSRMRWIMDSSHFFVAAEEVEGEDWRSLFCRMRQFLEGMEYSVQEVFVSRLCFS